jgi:hypothetical protein
MHPSADAFLQRVVAGRWRLLEVLDATEHGAAYRVETLDAGRVARLELWEARHVAGRGELARFERGARTLSRLRHERCLSLVDFGAHEGRPFLVSDLPEGKPLRDQLGSPELTVPRALSLALQLCEGLRHLHGHGVVHRALRPDNLWVTQAAGTDLLKIGLPRMGQITAASGAAGARFYLPPETPAGKPDHRADLYAAGMVLYVMCAGREPSAEVMDAVCGGAPVRPARAAAPERAIGEELERVILRAVAPSPEVRFQTADELLLALQSAGARAMTPKPRAAQRPRRRTAVVAGAFATVALLCAGAWRSGGRGPSGAPAAEAAPAPRQPEPAAAVVAAPPRAPSPAPARDPSPADAPGLGPPPAAPPAAASAGAPSQREHDEIWSLLDSGRLKEGAARIGALAARDPDGAWPLLARGVLYYRKYWRRDAVRQWQLALERDPEVRHDPQFGAYLCFMLDRAWQEAGVTDLLDRLGANAVPLLDQCVASAKSAELRALASRALAHLRPSGRRARR